MSAKFTACPVCGTACTIKWHGLDLVEKTGDETLASKSWHPVETIEQLREQRDELLEALKDAREILLKTYNSGARRDEVTRSMIEKIAAAIAKAEGRGE